MTKKYKYSRRRFNRRIYSHQRLVLNDTPTCHRITANFTGITRNDTFDGKDYLVAPMIMIVEGVLPGSFGPLYYPAEELSKTPAVWNMKPIVVEHPSCNGVGISACDPDVIRTRGVGLIMNAMFEDGKLKAEAWIDKAKAEIVDNRIIEAIENNEMMELSTGLFTDTESIKGEFNGKKYESIARNYRPDHLALLPESTGACSVADGAGFLRLNEAHDGVEVSVSSFDSKKAVLFFEENKEHIGKQIRDLIENEISHSQIWQLIHSKLRDTITGDDVWVDEVFDTFFIYSDGPQLYKQSYSVNDGKVTFIGSREAVTREVVFKTEDGSVLNNTNIRKDVNMKDKVDALIANALTHWTEADRKTLMRMDEAVLSKMIPVENKDDKNKKKVEEVVANTEIDTLNPTKDKVMTPEEYLAKAPPEVAATLNHGMNAYNAEKAQLVASIVANERASFTAAQLELKDVAELKQIAALASNVEVAPVIPVVTYNGQGEVIVNKDAATPEPLPIPSMDFST